MTTHPTPPPQGAGVGAWKLPKFYGLGMNMPDPARPDAAYQLQRVRWACIAIQRELIRRGHLAVPVVLDGGWGPKSDAALRSFQKAVKLPVTGKAGRAEMAILFGDFIIVWERVLKIPDHLLWGTIRLESALDPGAEGGVDNRDRGIGQYSRRWHPDVTDEVAFSRPDVCIERTAFALRGAYDNLGNWDAAVAHHNNPAKARSWAANGKAPDEQIKRYVELVRQNGHP